MAKTFRQERIERLYEELKYEIERGVFENELPSEEGGFRFIVPICRTIPGDQGVIVAEFRFRPVHRSAVPFDELQPRLRLVE